MILMGLVSMGIFFGMPKLMENSKFFFLCLPVSHLFLCLSRHKAHTHGAVDPEMKAEFEESQKNSPMSSLLTGGGGQANANPLGNFDMAAYLSGSGKKEDAVGEASPAGNSGNGGSGGKKGKK
jgi:hypothetical protein